MIRSGKLLARKNRLQVEQAVVNAPQDCRMGEVAYAALFDVAHRRNRISAIERDFRLVVSYVLHEDSPADERSENGPVANGYFAVLGLRQSVLGDELVVVGNGLSEFLDDALHMVA